MKTFFKLALGAFIGVSILESYKLVYRYGKFVGKHFDKEEEE